MGRHSGVNLLDAGRDNETSTRYLITGEMRAVECGPSRGVTGSCCVRDGIHLGVNDALVLIRSLPSRRGLFDSWRKAIVPGCDDVIVRIPQHCADLGERKSVGEGKSVSIRVELGGRRNL